MKASIVERFNRTLKRMMWKEFSYNGTYHWIDIYTKLIDTYNRSNHRTIKVAPVNVNSKNEKILLNTVYSNLKIFDKSRLRIGDYVRISKYKNIFEKGYTPTFVIYLLEDYQGNPIKGGFYKEGVLHTRYPNIFLVENVLKRKGDKAYVKWLGFPNEHNSWINKNDIL